MHNVFQSLTMGMLQGISEFFPISSTAHLILIPHFFNWPDPGLGFDVSLHLGTLIAVLTYFWKDWIMIFKLAFKGQVQNLKFKDQSYERNILWFLIVATVPGALAGYFFENQAETIFRNPLLIAFTLFSVGIVLYFGDQRGKKTGSLEKINFNKSLIIGLSQAVAIIPGISRSGATISAGLFLGLDRKSAARFSFLLSTPIIFGASLLKIPEFFKTGITASMMIGVFVSALSGYLAIKYLIKFIENFSYKIFFWYRLMLALFIVALFLLN